MRCLLLLASLIGSAALRAIAPRSLLRMALPLERQAKAVTAAVLAAVALQPAAPVVAANYFGGGSYSEVVAPSDAVLDQGLADSDDFKRGVEGLAKVTQAVKALKADFQSNKQMDVSARLASDFDVAFVRSSLNKFSAAFSEDTQRGGDRLIRQVIQGLTELDREASVKEGRARSGAKAEAILRRLSAVEDSLDTLAAYYKK